VNELLSIVVPVYNEEATVRAVIERLLSIDLPVAREILVVNDGSTDGTRGVLDAIPEAGDVLRIVHADVNGGKGRAIRTGFERARGTIVAIQDADLELDPAELATLVAPILAGESNVVYGSRFLHGTQGAPFISVAANRFLTALTNVLYGARLTDMETCYKVMRREVLDSMHLTSDGFGIEPEMTAKIFKRGYRVYEVPITYDGRSYEEGKKIGWQDGVVALWVLLRHRFTS
jgi:glycosyltransferase involved in cell wall biosynthesis